MPYSILDFETTATTSFKRTANPFDPRNKVIVKVFQHQNDTEVTCDYNRKGLEVIDLPWDTFDLLIGQNIKFDLLYIWKDPKLRQWLRNGGRIYDTMVAEYLLTAQQSTFISLDELSRKYGGTIKDDRVSEYFKVGLGADYVDPDFLLPYAVHDIKNTRIVYAVQQREIDRKQMGPLIDVYMDHLLATIEMEANGLTLDVDMAEQLVIEYTEKCKNFEDQIKGYLTLDFIERTQFSVDSNSHLSALLFNTPITSEIQVDTGKVYSKKAQKAGQPILKWEAIYTKADVLELPPKDRNGDVISSTKAGIYHTGSEVLEDLLKLHPDNKDAQTIINLILNYRESKKVLTTYLRGVKVTTKGTEETGFIPLVQTDGLIHHTLNLVSTVTGRLSSKNPNAQNIPGSLKYLFNSRFGKDGKILEIDYSQLEVCLQAYVTQSQSMIQEIESGVDFHCKRLAYAENKTYDEVVKLVEEQPNVWGLKRKAAKTISFQKAYGAQPDSLARTTGLPLEAVQRIFDIEDRDSPEINAFVDDVMEQIERSRIPYDTRILVYDKDAERSYWHDAAGGRGYYRSITGKWYHFIEVAVDSQKMRDSGRDIFRYFVKPQAYNYPIQGLAADLVSLMVGKLFRGILYTERELPEVQHDIKLINEVHDSVILDIRNTVPNIVIDHIEEALEDVPRLWEQVFKMKFNVPIKVEAKLSERWGEE